ncbi:MAG: hypothetical protein JNN03_23020 [Rubrivivax sp.]|nr:hypothetical protein [Rubrivivax sp.]
MRTPTPPEPHLSAANADGALMNAGPALAESVRTLGSQTRSAVQEFAGEAAHIARGGADAARQRAVSLRDAGSEYIRERPLQAVMIAAGAGALLMLLASLLRHRGGAPR